jgi:hypothetical protein
MFRFNYLIRFMFRLETVLNQPVLSLNFASSVKPFIPAVKHHAMTVKATTTAVLNLATPVKHGASGGLAGRGELPFFAIQMANIVDCDIQLF